MKITIVEQSNNDDVEVIIKGSKNDKTVKSIYQTLLYYDTTIIGRKEHKKYTLSLKNILYFDTVDNKTFAYTEDNIFDIQHRLYQLEERLEKTPFLRVNKHTILNVKKIKTFNSTINGRMEAKLLNGERIKISRRYVPNLKDKLRGSSL
ncbi:MAG: LytTR family transcriptional regulator DNA-binding domain-containing protein [Candidatus Izimaplasma sp.]|nr:LytTR family transcriptional regulator DNA-binding domain-containing protein [Candidatus Izimaplasma bacterium]